MKAVSPSSCLCRRVLQGRHPTGCSRFIQGQIDGRRWPRPFRGAKIPTMCHRRAGEPGTSGVGFSLSPQAWEPGRLVTPLPAWGPRPENRGAVGLSDRRPRTQEASQSADTPAPGRACPCIAGPGGAAGSEPSAARTVPAQRLHKVDGG